MQTSPTLFIDLDALAGNYRLLSERVAPAACAAVVKSDAYGLGVGPVAAALHAAGCRFFFVATLEEGIALRRFLGEKGDARIAVFHGPYSGEEKDYLHHALIPVLNSPAQAERWVRGAGGRLDAPAILHVDTGMCRLGFSERELVRLCEGGAPPISRHVLLLMSHLACANEPAHPKNAEQLIRFRYARSLLPGVEASLANSSGIFLSPDFHFSLARPGCALYGINPTEEKNPMRAVARLTAPILHVRHLDRDETVGYGATASLAAGSRAAIVQLGYADGMLRCLSNAGYAFIGGMKAPILGRVSMDMIALDVSHVPETALSQPVEFLNDAYTVNDLAHQAGTIGYEVFTRIGARVRREYMGGVDEAGLRP